MHIYLKVSKSTNRCQIWRWI